MDQPVAYAHMAYGFGANVQKERFLAGFSPEEKPYGFHHAEDFGWRVNYSNDAPESSLAAVIRKTIKRILGFDLIHAFRNRKLIREADIVWTNEEISYLSICALPFIVPGMKRPRLIAQTIWLFNRWESYSRLRRWMFSRLMSRADILTFHTLNYLNFDPTVAPTVPRFLLNFGISADTFPFTQRPATLHKPIRLLSMGTDATRDWPTLLAAFGNDPRFELRIVSGQVSDDMIANMPNVSCIRNPTMSGFRELYRWADAVVIAMVPNLFSGITVALEATSMGVPVFSSNTGGIPTYFDEDEAGYFPPRDPVALREAILAHTESSLSALVTKAQARFLRVDNTSHGLAKRYVELSNSVLHP